MEGFKDTNPALFHMTEELREQDLVAIYRPIKARGNVWLAYSRKSLGFSFMNWTTAKTPAGVPIYLAVRPPLPPMTALRSRERKEPIKARREFPENVRFRGDVSESRHSSLPASALEKIPTQRQKLAGPLSHGPIRQSPEAVSSTIREHAELETRKSSVTGLSVTSTMDPRLRRRPSLPAVVPAQDYIHPSRRSLVEGQADASGSYLSSPSKAGARNIGHEPRPSGGAGHEKPDAMDLTPDVQAHSTAPQRQEPVNALMPASDQTGTKILMDFFEKTLKMTVKELSSLDEGGADSSADNFYLHFPQDTQAEYQLIETWLKAHDVMVWTDWGKFIKNCKRGVVIVCCCPP